MGLDPDIVGLDPDICQMASPPLRKMSATLWTHGAAPSPGMGTTRSLETKRSRVTHYCRAKQGGGRSSTLRHLGIHTPHRGILILPAGSNHRDPSAEAELPADSLRAHGRTGRLAFLLPLHSTALSSAWAEWALLTRPLASPSPIITNMLPSPLHLPPSSRTMRPSPLFFLSSPTRATLQQRRCGIHV